jgi:predicted short-subunit dehydrogenase-like oxidoreductase (DUF2520 family)
MPAREAASLGEVVIVAVADDDLSTAAREIARAVRPGALVLHTSGAVGSEALASVRRRGARAASLHPLMTFPTPKAGLSALRGASFFYEGDPGTAPALRSLVRALGGAPVPLDRRAKTLYHAGAVLACNALVALLAEAFGLFRDAGIPERAARASLGPLVRRTVENVLASGPAAALTGPVARGDLRTVRRHLAALRGLPREVYRALGAATLRLARLPRARRTALARLFRSR